MTVIRTPNDIKQMMKKIEEANAVCKECPNCGRKIPLEQLHKYIPKEGAVGSLHFDQYTCKTCGTIWESEGYFPIPGFTDEEVAEMALS